MWISPAPFGDDALHGNVFAPGFVNARTAVMCRQRAGEHKAAANSANTAIAKTRCFLKLSLLKWKYGLDHITGLKGCQRIFSARKVVDYPA